MTMTIEQLRIRVNKRIFWREVYNIIIAMIPMYIRKTKQQTNYCPDAVCYYNEGRRYVNAKTTPRTSENTSFSGERYK